MGNTAKKNIAVLGSTGSIGKQALDVIRQHPDKFKAALLVANNSWEALCAQALEFNADDVVICNGEHFHKVKEALEGHGISVHEGMGAVCDLVSKPEIDIVLTSMVGFSGLESTVAAIKAGKTIALANKESLVAGGELVKQALAQHHRKLFPIDSEHSAIFQCLQGNKLNEVRRLIITASGGSFRDKSREELVDVTVKEALSHPNWNMGGRITIDSATMMNKGFEVIEAHYLFDLPYEQIDVILHRESVVHSMVEYQDHAIIAQMGTADMRLPIQYALSYPDRLVMHNAEPFHFMNYPSLHFEAMSFERYPLLKLAYEVGKKQGNLGAVMNGADECAVALFLKGKIPFLAIERLVIEAVEQAQFIAHPSLDQLKESDRWARDFVLSKQGGACR